jgi:hypothetical protein
VAISFGEISSSANPFIPSLAASLLEDWEDDTQRRLLATLKQLNPVNDEDVAWKKRTSLNIYIF